MKYNLSEVRQTYIIMWHENGVEDPNGVRYIFNRSISWGNINFKRLQPLIDLLGEDSIKRMLCINDKLDNDVNKLTTQWVIDTDIFTLLEVHSEWENYNHQDQDKINKRKEKLANTYNAYIRKDKIVNPEVIKKIEKDLLSNVKLQLNNYIISLIREGENYIGEIYKPYICTYYDLIEKINMLKNEYTKISKINKDIQQEIYDNRQTLRRQNYIINKQSMEIWEMN